MASIGQELRKEREARGFSLKEIADSTRITLKYLEAIESDSFNIDIFPGEFFTKSMIRSYARAVGLDEDQLVERYRRAGLLQSGTPEGVKGSWPQMTKRQKLSLAALAAAVLVIITFAAYFLTKHREPATLSETREAIPQIPQQASVMPSMTEAVPAPVPKEEEKGLNLELSFHERTWIQVYADQELALDGIKLVDEKARVTAQNELVIHLGNAGGLDYFINGRPGKSFGRSGAVVKNIRITPDNKAEFVRDDSTETE